ncbi:Alpha/Beta hydrolase protein [Mycena latifolia]|nr:Alpha/Beta hydrolase protein [Mycena latifolia]
MAQPYTEHTLKLPDGIEILYTDSGAPPTPDYTTLVVLHGTGFNGYGFVPLHAHAHKHNLRTILWNRRDYHGSTKYTNEELADLHAGRRIFQDRQALQIAWFLEHFIEHEKTPKVTADRTARGFILLGWSSGCSVVLALFADPSIFPPGLYDTVEPYLRSLVLYDPPVVALGYPPPEVEGFYDPFNDPECTSPDQAFDNFQKWITSYFKHPDIASGNPSGMSFEKFTPKRTISGWTEEEMAKYCEKFGAIRSIFPLFVFYHTHTGTS